MNNLKVAHSVVSWLLIFSKLSKRTDLSCNTTNLMTISSFGRKENCLQVAHKGSAWKLFAFPPSLFFFFSKFPDNLVGKESACNAWDCGSIPGSGRSPGEGKSYPLQYPGLENSMDCIVHGLQRVGHDWVTFTSLHFLIIVSDGLWQSPGKRTYMEGWNMTFRRGDQEWSWIMVQAINNHFLAVTILW